MTAVTRTILEAERVERIQPSPGQYWRAVEPHKELEDLGARVGDVLLVEDVAFADGVLHTITVRGHPRTKDERNQRFLLDDFLVTFELAEDAAGVRSAEIGDVIARIDRLRAELSPPDDIAAAGRLMHQGGGTNLPAVTDVAAERKRLTAAQNRALSIATRIDKTVKKISDASRELQSFMEEKSAAALAAAASVRRLADWYAGGAATIGLFAGDGVEVRQLCDGAVAPAGPLHVLQRLLFLDEEYLAHLASGGADWRDLDDFANALANDSALLDRILPFERCVVAMRYRRHPKEYLRGVVRTLGRFSDALEAATHLLQQAQQAAADNEANRETFLLVRNGRRVTQVFAALSTNHAHRLFPSVADLRSHFQRRVWHTGDEIEEITLQSLDYTDALSSLEHQKTLYRRLIVTMWGVHVRDETVFGDLYARNHQTWLSPAFQRDALRLVRDDENVIDSGRPSAREFRKSQNNLLRAGSRVVVDWTELVSSSSSAPGAWSNSYRYKPRQIVFPKNDIDIVVVRELNGRFFAECPAERTNKQAINLKVHLDDTDAFLVLDGLVSDDLLWYLTNRADRERYLSYWRVFDKGRRYLKDLEHECGSVAQQLAADLRGSRKIPDDQIDNIALRGIARWRLTQSWRAPTPRDLPALRDFAWNEAFAAAGSAEPLVAACAIEGRDLLRVVAVGDARFAYATPTAAEAAAAAVFSPRDGWVLRCPVKTDRVQFDRGRWQSLPAADSRETVIHQSEKVETWSSRPILRVPRAEALGALDELGGWRSRLQEALSPTTLAAVKADYRAVRRDMRGGMVIWPDMFIGIGLAVDADVRDGAPDLHVVGASIPFPVLALMRLPVDDLAEARDMFADTYRNKSAFTEMLPGFCDAALDLGRLPFGKFRSASALLSTGVGDFSRRSGDDFRFILPDDARAWLTEAGVLPGQKKRDRAGLLALLNGIRPGLSDPLK